VAIIAEASLSFLGLAAAARAQLGFHAQYGEDFLEQATWMAVWPGIAIFLVVIGFNLLGDGLRDALDPRETE